MIEAELIENIGEDQLPAAHRGGYADDVVLHGAFHTVQFAKIFCPALVFVVQLVCPCAVKTQPESV